ncbi:MAG: hypothetical protein ABR537_10590 [Gemmatimonadales bacterium]
MRALVPGIVLWIAACGPRNACTGHQFERSQRYSAPYAGRWLVARGDTLTFPTAPGMSDRFRLAEVGLDTATVVVGRECLFRGDLVFRAPRAETLAVTWFGQPEQAIVSGWPVDLGPFAGISLAPAGRDSMAGTILFDAKLGVQARPGMTARFIAGRTSRLSSRP